MAVEYSYEPGSTFKVVTMGAALTAGIVTPQTQFRIPYAIKVGDRIVHDDAPRPTKTFTAAQILQQSSNVGTVTIAELVHKQPLYDWIRRWGFGSPTHIGLPAEASPAPSCRPTSGTPPRSATSRSARASRSRRCRWRPCTRASPTAA